MFTKQSKKSAGNMRSHQNRCKENKQKKTETGVKKRKVLPYKPQASQVLVFDRRNHTTIASAVW